MDYIFLAIIIASHGFLSIRLLKSPLHPDTGQFLYRGFFSAHGKRFPYFKKMLDAFWVTIKKIFKFGGVDYKFTADLYDQTPKNGYLPLCQKIGSYFFAHILGRASGKNPKAFRYYMAFYNALSIIAIFYLGQIFYGAAVGLISAAVFAGYINIPYSDTRQLHAEHFLILPIMLCIILFFLGVKYSFAPLFFIAGALSFLVFAFKSSAVLEVLFLFFVPIIIGGGTGASLLTFGGFLAVFLIFLIILAIKKILIFYFYLALSVSSFVDYKKGINYTVHKEEFNLAGGSLVAKLKMYIPFVLQMFFLAFGVISFMLLALTGADIVMIFLIVWILVELFVIQLQGKYFFSHLVPLFPPAAIMSAMAFAKFLSLGNPAYLVAFLSFLLISFFAVFKYWFVYDPLKYQLKLYSSLKHEHTLRFSAAEVVADYIKQHTEPDDRIKIWGFNAEFYVLAERQEHSGFNEDKVLCDPIVLESFWGQIWRKWFLRDMINDPPKYIVDFYGNLNVDFINKTTGLDYHLEKIFYSMFPIYKLSGRIAQEPSNFTDVDFCLLDGGDQGVIIDGKKMPLKELIISATSLFVNGNVQEADRLTAGGLHEMINDWYKINFRL